MRFILLDRITLLEPPDRALGIKCVSLSDDVFVDHFPGHPVMPGALILESMAQLGGVLVESTIRARGETDMHAVWTMVDRGRFRKVVVPGDRMALEATSARVTIDGGRVKVVARVEGELVAESELTFVLTRLTNPKLIERRQAIFDVWLHGAEQA